jgi:hypothetical protein
MDLGGVEMAFNEGLVTFTNLSHQPKAVKIYDKQDLEGEGDEDEDDDDFEFEGFPVYEFDLECGESTSKVLVQMSKNSEIVKAEYVLRTYTRVPVGETIAISDLPNALAEMILQGVEDGDINDTYLEPDCEFDVTVEDDKADDKDDDQQDVTVFTVFKITNVVIPPGKLGELLDLLRANSPQVTTSEAATPTGTSEADAAALGES